ncbi:alpha-amylase family glycosyl hydrolase, partial [Salmonella enterica]
MSSKIFCKSWGAEYIAADVVRFRLWATGQQKVMLRLAGKDQEMRASGDGWFTLDVSGVTPGTEYNFVLSDGMVVPDPASRAQKTDVNGPSYVVDPGSYAWRNTGWKGSRWEQAVVYEMHTGTFTPEGTFRAAIAKLPYLAELGVTVIEVMPVAQFGGERGWGYDGVLLYAPHSAYGTPDDFKAFIDAAHGYGLSVVLDIVLNHFGPEGNYLPLLAPAFFHKERMTPWGNGIAYDVDAVRRYIIEAPLYWLTEYHLDGLRFDAIDQIEDSSAKHVLVEIAQRIPDDFKAFIDAAHGYGLSVVLDIVLNHFGPEGNYLPLLAPAFFHKERMTPWGNGIAYDVDAVRRYIIEAPLYWLTEYHLDGLRFDAIDQIEDSSAKHVLVEIAQRI